MTSVRPNCLRGGDLRLRDPRAVEAPDFYSPNRFVAIGMSWRARVLFVVFAVRKRGTLQAVSATKSFAKLRSRQKPEFLRTIEFSNVADKWKLLLGVIKMEIPGFGGHEVSVPFERLQTALG